MAWECLVDIPLINSKYWLFLILWYLVQSVQDEKDKGWSLPKENSTCCIQFYFLPVVSCVNFRPVYRQKKKKMPYCVCVRACFLLVIMSGKILIEEVATCFMTSFDYYFWELRAYSNRICESILVFSSSSWRSGEVQK